MSDPIHICTFNLHHAPEEKRKLHFVANEDEWQRARQLPSAYFYLEFPVADDFYPVFFEERDRGHELVPWSSDQRYLMTFVEPGRDRLFRMPASCDGPFALTKLSHGKATVRGVDLHISIWSSITTYSTGKVLRFQLAIGEEADPFMDMNFKNGVKFSKSLVESAPDLVEKLGVHGCSLIEEQSEPFDQLVIVNRNNQAEAGVARA